MAWIDNWNVFGVDEQEMSVEKGVGQKMSESGVLAGTTCSEMHKALASRLTSCLQPQSHTQYCLFSHEVIFQVINSLKQDASIRPMHARHANNQARPPNTENIARGASHPSAGSKMCGIPYSQSVSKSLDSSYHRSIHLKVVFLIATCETARLSYIPPGSLLYCVL